MNEVGFPSNKDSQRVITFFDSNLDENSEAIVSDEFLCPFGINGAIKKKQVIITVNNNEIIAAVRFYPRKTDGIVSVYQFAINKEYRGNQLLQGMLQKTKFNKFEFKCPREINFNEYYRKIGANISKQDDEYNYWSLVLK